MIEMRMKFILASVGLLTAANVFGGDAVAIGYTAEGVWTAVTYYCSSTPKGGNDYKAEKEARDEAVRDLRAQAPEQLARTEILSSSDSTGYATVARGKHRSGKEFNVVGRGKSQEEADEKALAQLKKARATGKQQIVYRYFSHGSDSR